MSEPKRTLIPQYSIRWLLMVTTLCAVVFSVFGLAVNGSHWAVGVSIAVVSLVIVMLGYAIVFGLVWLFSLIAAPFLGSPVGTGRSPFSPVRAAGAPPVDDKDVPAVPIILE